MALKDTLLAEYDHEMATTRRLLTRVPDDKLTWQPHEKSMTLAGLGTHLGTIPRWGVTILKETSFNLESAPPNPDPLPSRASILSLFDETVGQARALMDQSDGEYVSKWTLTRGDTRMFTMPRITAFRTFVINHSVHHRGQLSVYLRVNNVPVPPIYGPSADEG
jgi:uncharacterized damage-inducible protein DinB